MQRRIAGGLAVAVLALATACTADAAPHRDDPVPGPVPTAVGDPVVPAGTVRLSDPQADYWAAAQSEGMEAARLPDPIVHHRGTGPAGFRLPALDLADASGIRIFVTCTGDADFRATFGSSYSGACSADGASSAALPLDADSGILTLEVPEGTEYWLLVVPS